MQSATPPASPLTSGMRNMLYIASGLVLLEGTVLYLLSDQTATFFAWTVNPPLTAAFLGAGYWAAFLLEFLSARAPDWPRARVAVPAVLMFTTMTLVLTLLHLDRFHLSDPNLITQGAAWVWLVVYAVVPPVLLVLLVRQLRIPHTEPPRTSLVPVWLRAALWVQGAIMLALGVVFFLSPQAAGAVWPWPLTPLTGRAVAAWLVGVGVAAAHMAWENDLARARIGLLAYLVFGALQLVALARYPGAVDWAAPHLWLYLVFIASILVVGSIGTDRARRGRLGVPVSEVPPVH